VLGGDGSLTTGDRLARIEKSIDILADEFRTLASNTELRDISTRVTFLERDYVPQSSVKRYWLYIIAQSVVIMGAGLGFVYELLQVTSRHAP
jgi:hypothetical protein